jgi:DNA repair protein RecN (Recombination protein N)
MLRFLSVRQLAVIEHVEVELGPGLTVVTGETGAGKSILVEAIDLLLGGRASADLVRTGAEAAHVQAIVESPNGTEVVVRREISASGRSRAFVDGTLVTSAQLRDLTGPLIDLHGQHEHQALLAPGQHLQALDRFAGNDAERVASAHAFAAWNQTRAALEACQLDDRERRARAELASFHLNEIDRAAPAPGEDDLLAVERQRLAGAERISRLANEAYLLLYEGDTAVVGGLAQVWRRVAELAQLDPEAAPHLEARDPIRSQLDELSRFLRHCAAAIEAAPDRLQLVEDRLALLERLKRRHGPALADVLARQASLREELALLRGGAEQAAGLERELAARRDAFLQAATRVSSARQAAAVRLRAAMERALADLAMPRAEFVARVQPRPDATTAWSADGFDVVEFQLSANPGEAVRPLARVASGGELSRVMLALKTLASTDADGKTLIFDEVDAGIGGAVADTVGSRLRALGARCQVLCVTHLPQVAAHGHEHLRVAKEVAGDRTLTSVERLTAAGRVEELARMIGGTAVTPTVLAGAGEMLAARAKGKETTKGESEGRKGGRSR